MMLHTVMLHVLCAHPFAAFLLCSIQNIVHVHFAIAQDCAWHCSTHFACEHTNLHDLFHGKLGRYVSDVHRMCEVQGAGPVSTL